MTKVLSYFRKNIPVIILLVIFLGLQVKCQLLLPRYTSDIVNVGIQQGGIETPVPGVIDESTYGRLLSLSDVENKKVIATSYEYWVPGSKSKANKEIKDNNPYAKLIKENRYKNNYYVLKSDNISDGLESAMSDSLTRLAKYSMSVESNKLSSKQAEVLTDSKIPDFVKKQIGIRMVRNIYKANGIDPDSIQKRYLWTTGFKMLGMALISGIFALFVSLFAAQVAADVAKRLRGDSFRKVMEFSNVEMDKFSISSLIARTTNDIQQIQRASALALKFIFYGPFTAVGAFIAVTKLKVSMIWIIVLAVVMTLLSIAVIMYNALPKFNRIQKIVDRLNQVTREFISGIEVNRVFGTKKYEEKRFDDVNTDLTATNLFVNRMVGLMQPIMMFIMNGATLLIVWFGAKNIEAGHIQVGDMMAFIQYAILIIMAFLFISMLSVVLPRSVVSANRVAEVLNTEPVIVDSGTVENFSEKGTLEFKNVTFRYEGAEENVIEDINFRVEKGKTLAIIGSTGSGKSTLINLIPRFLDVTNGAVLVDGVDVREMPLRTLREKISVVPQKAVIFSGTVASNIEYGSGIMKLSRMESAAEIAQASEFINEKEDGFNSEVSQEGANFSGGQKQRLSIARAIARNPEILVFDDSFSALDSRTDRNLRMEIKKHLKEKTLVIVAQRINTIIDSDEIIVLENGRIAGRGTHDELLDTCDVYYEIAKSQLAEEELRHE